VLAQLRVNERRFGMVELAAKTTASPRATRPKPPGHERRDDFAVMAGDMSAVGTWRTVASAQLMSALTPKQTL
jgi:hypothetical protein